MRTPATVIAALLFCGSACSQNAEEPTVYNGMTLGHAGIVESTLSGVFRVRKMTGAVEIRLLAEDPQDNLDVKAESIEFFYDDDGASMASRMVLEGDVEFQQPQVHVLSDSADVDLATERVRFFGNVRLNHDQIQDLEATEILLNLSTRAVTMIEAKAGLIEFDRSEETRPWDSLMLTQENINGWPELLTLLKAQVAGPDASPGKQLVRLFDDSVQKLFNAANVDALLTDTSAILSRINSVLTSPDLYVAAAWQEVTLDRDTLRIAAAGPEKAEAVERVWFNRMLLHAAFPRHFQQPPALGEEARQ